jgi:hypothetical protein
MVENTNSTTLEVQGSFGLTYMVGLIPLILRSQEMDKGVPRARRRRPGQAGRGVAWPGQARRTWCGVVWSCLFVYRVTLLLQLPTYVSPSASLCERLNRGAPLSLGTRENTLSESQSSRRVKVFPSRDSAHTEKREGRCLRSRCRSRPCTRDQQLGFWGASSRLPKTSPT